MAWEGSPLSRDEVASLPTSRSRWSGALVGHASAAKVIMARQTSIQAYEQIKADGTLNRARWEVYDCLYHHGPMTRNELDSHLAPGKPNAPYSRRLAEMERMGVIQRVATRPCRVSGVQCEIWDVTSNLPSPLPKDAKPLKPSKAKVEKAVLELRKVRGRLKKSGHPDFSENLVEVCRWLQNDYR